MKAPQTSPDRLPPIPREHWTAEQADAVAEIVRGPRGAMVPPFVPLMRSPELMTHAQRMGEYLRYRSAIGQQLSELAILVVARHWSQRVEWAIHAPIARNAGLPGELIAYVEQGIRPSAMDVDQETVHDVCVELLRTGGVSDAPWSRLVQRFGEQGAVDLLGLVGYYTFLALVMNGARTELLPPA